MTTNHYEAGSQSQPSSQGWLSRIGVSFAALTTLVVSGCAHMRADRELAELWAEPTPWEDVDREPMTERQQQLTLMAVERSREFEQEVQKLMLAIADRLACTCPDEDERMPLSFELLSRVPSIDIVERSEFAIGDQDVGDGEGATLSSMVAVYNDRTGGHYAHVNFTLYLDDEGNFATGVDIEHVDGGAISSQTGLSDTYEFADWGVDSTSANLGSYTASRECVAMFDDDWGASFGGLGASDDIGGEPAAAMDMGWSLHVRGFVPNVAHGQAVSVPYRPADSCE